MSSELVRWLVESTILSSIAILLVLGLRPPLKSLFGPRTMIMIWALVPIIVLMPALPDRAIEPMDRPSGAMLTIGLNRLVPDPAMRPDTTPSEVGQSVSLLGKTWLVGAVLLLLLLMREQRRFRTKLGQLQPLGKRLYRSEHASHGPLLIGLLAPKIIVPKDFEHRFDTRQRRLMLAHELTHIERLDPLWNLIAAGLRCLFWFNPMVHWGANRFRRDQELACDAQVLAKRQKSGRAYADALLALANHRERMPVLAFGPHSLKERIMNLSALQRETTAHRRIGTLAVVGLAFVLASVAWAVTPEQGSKSDDDSLTSAQMFSFDVEVTVGGQTEVGKLLFAGDLGRVSSEHDQVRMFARERLRLEHKDDASGWVSDIEIQRVSHDEFDVRAQISMDGETIATPRMLIGTDGPATIEVGDLETGDPTYRVKLIPVIADTDPVPGH